MPHPVLLCERQWMHWWPQVPADKGDTWFSSQFGVSDSHEAGAALMPTGNNVEIIGRRDCIQHWQIAFARYTKSAVEILLLEAVN